MMFSFSQQQGCKLKWIAQSRLLFLEWMMHKEIELKIRFEMGSRLFTNHIELKNIRY